MYYDDRFFKLYYPTYEEGRKFEANGEPGRAIELYLHILKRFRPCGTAYYDRPAILLEKAHRYREAQWVCRKALENQELGIFNGHVSEELILTEYNKRLTRLAKKIEKERSKELG